MRNIFNPSKFIYSYLADYLKKYRDVLKGSLVDVGCGNKPFEKIFRNVDTYFGIDISNSGKADLVCDVLDIRVENEIADSVLCTQVIEHVPDPDKLISEIHRISKPGAYCILTAPHFSRIHGAPNDFFRFTPFGLRYLFEKHGFEIIAIEGMKGGWLTFIYLVMFYFFDKMKKFSLLFTPWFCLFYLVIQKLDRDGRYAFNYILVAKKKED